MIELSNVNIVGIDDAMRGMRNPKNSWEKGDTKDGVIGKDDMKLAKILANAGTDHGKFLRFIMVYMDINAPLYWWKEFDTYRVGVEKNSCSTMHKIADKEFELADFSCEHLETVYLDNFKETIKSLNDAREMYLYALDEEKSEKGALVPAKNYWWQMIQLLPSSYNQKRTVVCSYAALRNMYHARKNHKLDEWRNFCKIVELFPYSQLITGEDKDER